MAAALFLAMFCVLYINARTSLISIIALIVIFLVYYFRNNSFKNKASLVKMSYIFIPLIVAFFYTETHRSEGGRYGKSVFERMKEINAEASGAKARLLFWENAITITKKHPVLGVGLGNWRVESIPYEPPVRSKISLNTHNDYLEIFAETGVLNGFLYLSVFVALLLINLRVLFKSKESNKKIIALLALMLLVVYGNDAFFNFPMYRPTMQLAFAFLLVLTIVNFVNKEEILPQNHKTDNVQRSVIPLFFVAILPLYVTWHSDKTILLETKIIGDPVYKDITATPRMKAEEIVNHRPKLPNVMVSSAGSFAENAGVLYYKEKNYDEAIKYFDIGNEINPYLGKSDYYKYLIALERKEIDKAYDHIKLSFYRRARDLPIYIMLLKMATVHKDSAEVIKSYKHYNSIHHDPAVLAEVTDALFNLRYDYDDLMKFIETEKTNHQDNSKYNVDSLFSTVYNRIGKSLFSAKKKDKAFEVYNKALQSDSINAHLMQNLGLYYVGELQYDKAIPYLLKSVEYPGLKDDGRSEFTLGLCYIIIQDKPNACKYLKIAKEKKYPKAEQFFNQNCK